jgi:UDPglucose 6-dehydrogenase
MTVAFVGMSHLGIVSAMGLAAKGVDTLCIDKNKELIDQLRIGEFPIVEEDLGFLYMKARDCLRFSADLNLLKTCSLVYISQDVPTDDRGQSDTHGIDEYIKNVVEFLNPESGIVILSQVRPGFTRKIKSTLSNYLAYQVETLVFGKAVERVCYPERYIVGLVDEESKLLPAHEKVLKLFDCPILTMNYESAELAKISINLFLASSVLAANSLAQLAEKIGARWSDIESALKLDKRIGSRSYTSPGLGISGGNIERDIRSAEILASSHNCDLALYHAIESNSLLRKQWPSKILLSLLPNLAPKPTVAMWGLTYKSKTHSLKNSPALRNIENLMHVCNLQISDPLVDIPAHLSGKVRFHDNPLEALEGADVLIIFNDSKEFSQFSIDVIKTMMRDRIIIDPYRVLSNKVDSDFDYFVLGSKPKLRNRGSLN